MLCVPFSFSVAVQVTVNCFVSLLYEVTGSAGWAIAIGAAGVVLTL